MKIGTLLLFIVTLVCGNLFSLYGYTLSPVNQDIHILLDSKDLIDIYKENEIIQRYIVLDNNEFDISLKEIIATAKTNNNLNTVFKGYIALARFHFYKNEFPVSEKYVDKALKYATTNKDIAVSKLILAEISIKTKKFLNALEYFRQARQIITNTNSNEYVYILLREGYCYTKLGKYDIAKELLDKTDTIVKKNNIKDLFGIVYMYKGHLFYAQFDYLNALANFHKGLEYFEKDVVIRNYAIILYYIGRIYREQGDYVKAENNLNQAYILFTHIQDKISVNMINYELASIYMAIGDYDKSENLLNKCYEYFNSIKYESWIAKINILMSQILLSEHKKQQAREKLSQIDPYILTINDDNIIFDYYKQWAKYYLKTNKTDSALYVSSKINTQINENLPVNKFIEFQFLMSQIYEASGKYRKALLFQREGDRLKDSLFHKINSYEIKVLQSELELSKKNILIETLNNQSKQQQETIQHNKVMLERQKALIYLGLIVLLFLLIIAFILAKFLHRKRKDNKALELSNRKIAQQKEEIEMQSSHLLEANKELEELSLIARETDNAIKIMNGVGKVLWVNEGYTKMHGHTLDDIKEIENIDFLGEQANIDIHKLVNVWYGDKQPISYESLSKTKDGKEIWVQTTLTPLLNEDGKVEKMIAIESDITKLKTVENELKIKNDDITSSIAYAKRIQEAMMPPFSIIDNVLPDNFCFYKPKSIVSGDFYWFSQKNNRIIIACADSTGHGVPGAFMSMIGISFLNKIVNEKGFVSPSIILNRMRMNIINHLHQEEDDIIAGDGMDMAVISIDIKSSQLEYAGAMNPVFIIRGDSIIELKPDRMPVAFFDDEDRPFSSTLLTLEPNDVIFMFTDGFYDQFGGKNSSKMKRHRFKDILKQTAKLPSEKQKEFIEHEFDKWKGNNPQIDDVLIMGITYNP